MRRLLHRILPAIIIYGMIGAVVSTGIAWFCGSRGATRARDIADMPVRDAQAVQRRYPASAPASFRWSWSSPGVREDRLYIASTMTDDARQYAGPVRADLEEIAATLSLAGTPLDDFGAYLAPFGGYAGDSTYPHAKRIRAGLPFLCYETWWYPWENAMYAEIVSGSIEPEPGRIPVTPMPLPLLANTTIYGGLAWLLVAGTRAARGMLRARRGLCRGCGYAIADEPVCPECGRGTGFQPGEGVPASTTNR